MRALRGAALAVLLAGSAVLGGCARGETVQPAAGPEQPHAVVAPRQAERILDAVDAAVARAATATDPDRLPSRILGPARQEAAAAVRLRAALRSRPTAARAPDRSRLLLTRAGGWPRWFLVAGTVEGRPTPQLRVLWSPSAREPYGLWAQPALLPGAVLPTVASEPGALTLSPRSGRGLVRSPQQVVERYVEVLDRGDASPAAKEFSKDTFRTQLAAALSSARTSLGAANVSSRHRRTSDPVLALRTADGGALVIAALQQESAVKVGPGQQAVKIDDKELAALFGGATIRKELRRTAVEVLVFAVPSARAGGPVRVIAASRTDLRATGS